MGGPIQDPRIEANRNSKSVMVVRPSNGVIQPFSKIAVEFTFQPPATPLPQKGFTSEFAQEPGLLLLGAMVNAVHHDPGVRETARATLESSFGTGDEWPE